MSIITSLQQSIETHYRPEEYPSLTAQSRIWRTARPLKGVAVLDATPVFRNTLTKYLPLLEAGASLTVGVAAGFPHDPSIVALLEQNGIPILRNSSSNQPAPSFDLILDCAAAFSHLEPRLGYVELTRSGVERYSGATRPVFAADSGKIKRIETCLGTGESYYRAMAALGYNQWEGRTLVVFGSGKVGTGIMLYASRLGARIRAVTDPADISPRVASVVEAVIDFRDRKAVTQALADADAVVTATGVRNALNGLEEVLNRSTALLANMGVEDEFGPGVPAGRVLGRKQPLNFLLEEPTHLKYIETTMALHNEGAVWLATHPAASGIVNPPEEIENRLLAITRRDGLIGDEIGLIL